MSRASQGGNPFINQYKRTMRAGKIILYSKGEHGDVRDKFIIKRIRIQSEED
jgi:hypothetical protein